MCARNVRHGERKLMEIHQDKLIRAKSGKKYTYEQYIYEACLKNLWPEYEDNSFLQQKLKNVFVQALKSTRKNFSYSIGYSFGYSIIVWQSFKSCSDGFCELGNTEYRTVIKNLFLKDNTPIRRQQSRAFIDFETINIFVLESSYAF